MRRLIHVPALFAALALALAACASAKATGLPTGPTTPPASKVCGTVNMTDALKFVPEECTATVGQEVVWKNVGGVPHTVTSEEGVFDSGIASQIQAGGEYSFTFTEPGTYEYYCILHAVKGARSGMIGTIEVEAST